MECKESEDRLKRRGTEKVRRGKKGKVERVSSGKGKSRESE